MTTDKNIQAAQDFKLKPINLLLNVLGMALVFFATYEIYMMNEKGSGAFSELIAWQYYPWVFMILGVALMVPFHRQIRQAYKIVKQQKKDLAKRNKPDF